MTTHMSVLLQASLQTTVGLPLTSTTSLTVTPAEMCRLGKLEECTVIVTEGGALEWGAANLVMEQKASTQSQESSN